MNKQIEQFYIEWKANLDSYLAGYAFGVNNKPKKTRLYFSLLSKYLNDLLLGTLAAENKIIILPGIRGVGKTTLLAHLYFAQQFSSQYDFSALDEKIYISADRLLSENISLHEFFDFLEKKIFGNLIINNKKILILIDEVQYDNNWDLFLKLLFDKTKANKNILVVATGSSAIFLNKKNKDLSRRAKIDRIVPVKFSEYLYLHYDFNHDELLSQKIKDALFSSNTASDLYNSLKKLESPILKQLASIINLEPRKEDYFLRGSFPFSAEMDTQSLAMERIKAMILVNIVQKDLILFGDFDSETLVKIPDALFLLANSDEVSLSNLSSSLNMHPNTLNKVLSLLVEAEILYKLKPYGQPYKQIKKSAKFLFTSPNLRAGLLNGFIRIDAKGKLLEDYVLSILEQELHNSADFFYDYAKGGADFIVRFKDRREIVIEVGFGKEKLLQVEKTLTKTKKRANYGLIIGSHELSLSNNLVKIPLNYFLLI